MFSFIADITMSILYEADLRIQRASEHLTELEIELLRFERVKFVEILTGLPEEDPRAKEEDAKFWEWMRRNKPEPRVPSRARILIGEVAYNLVAALDYLIFVLTRFDSGAEQDGTQFPVCKCKKFFERGRNTMLKGMSDEHVALIERLQPYNGCTWIKRLKEISNLDKHRQLVRAQATALNVNGSDANAPRETAKEARVRRRAKLPKPPVKIYFGDSLVVTFDDGSPIIKTLEILKSQVSDVFIQFKPIFDP